MNGKFWANLKVLRKLANLFFVKNIFVFVKDIFSYSMYSLWKIIIFLNKLCVSEKLNFYFSGFLGNNFPKRTRMLHGVLLLDGRQPIRRCRQPLDSSRKLWRFQQADRLGEVRVGTNWLDPGESVHWTTQKIWGKFF